MYNEGLIIFALMLGAAILGFLIGWFLHRYLYTRNLRILQARYNEQTHKYNQLQNELMSLRAQAKESEKQHLDLLAKLRTLKSEKEKLEHASRDAQSPPTAVRPPKARVPQEEPEATTLARIQARATELDFDQIGLASFDEKDDLKQIKGIGPFLEKKLHSLGIYTFRQIANFTEELEDKVNDVIEFFPGRIRRDEWVKQAKAFVDARHASPDA